VALFGGVVSVRFFQPGKLAQDHYLIKAWKPVLKPLKIIAEGTQCSGGPRSIRFHKRTPEVFLNESASDSIDVHDCAPAIFLGNPDSIIDIHARV
jgi:hypothetical protein